MPKLIGYLVHPVNQTREPIYEGYCWSCLLFGCFWYGYKGLWGWAVLSFFLACFTFGVSWLIMPAFANEQYLASLRKKGYLTEGQAKELEERVARSQAPSVAAPPATFSVADEIGKLAKLRTDGMLSEQEFEVQKARILGT